MAEWTLSAETMPFFREEKEVKKDYFRGYDDQRLFLSYGPLDYKCFEAFFD